jgi:hypothetical protein
VLADSAGVMSSLRCVPASSNKKFYTTNIEVLVRIARGENVAVYAEYRPSMPRGVLRPPDKPKYKVPDL